MCFTQFVVIWTIPFVMSCINFNMVLRKTGSQGYNIIPGRITLAFNWKTSWCIWLLADSGEYRS